MAYADRHIFSSAQVDLNGATDVDTLFAPINRITIHKIALLPTSADAGGATVVFERRRVATTDTTIETVVIPAADHEGDMIYTEVVNGFEMVPGDRLNLAVTEGGTAPTVLVLLEYSINDMDLDNGISGVVIESA